MVYNGQQNSSAKQLQEKAKFKLFYGQFTELLFYEVII